MSGREWIRDVVRWKLMPHYEDRIDLGDRVNRAMLEGLIRAATEIVDENGSYEGTVAAVQSTIDGFLRTIAEGKVTP